ncbi:MAG TPA: hypothetical protein DDW52_19880 [Planctomycetaceae bacterium]|nr:hypothetical protein [Planctomycetaceae bacterium]
MTNRTLQQSQFHRSVWVSSVDAVDDTSEQLIGETTVQFLAECGECLAMLERAWPTTQRDGLEEPSQWVGEVLLGRYELASEIGRGSFGAVYSAVDLELGREVAIKLPLNRNFATVHPQLAELPRQEAQALAKLVHPNILRIYDVGRTSDHPFFIVSQRVRGAPLSTKLPISANDAARIFAKIADALHCAHSNGIIHRDIKPSNVLIDERDEPLLVDFGLAIQDDDRLDSAGQAGTLIYMPPEQINGNQTSVDERSDIYSLGITLYECLTGTTPFPCTNKPELLEAIKQGADLQMPGVPAPLKAIVSQATQVDPDQRFQSAAELHIALLGVESRGATLPSNSSTDHSTALAWTKSIGWIALAVCLLASVAYFLPIRQKRDNVELLFDAKNVASSPLRARALLSYVEEQRDSVDPESYPVGSSETKGQIDLHEAQLQNVMLGYNTDLTDVCFYEADMTAVRMPSCLFARSSFTEATLVEAGMNGCDFVDATFNYADLSRGKFNYCSFVRATFYGANFSGANLEHACIADVKDWTNANLNSALLSGAIVDSADWIDRVAPVLVDPSALDGWRVERIPAEAELTDPRYYNYSFWVRPIE